MNLTLFIMMVFDRLEGSIFLKKFNRTLFIDVSLSFNEMQIFESMCRRAEHTQKTIRIHKFERGCLLFFCFSFKIVILSLQTVKRQYRIEIECHEKIRKEKNQQQKNVLEIAYKRRETQMRERGKIL